MRRYAALFQLMVRSTIYKLLAVMAVMGAVLPAAVVSTGAVRPAAATVICWLVLQ